MSTPPARSPTFIGARSLSALMRPPSLVTQIFNLPYRRIVFGCPSKLPGHYQLFGFCSLVILCRLGGWSLELSQGLVTTLLSYDHQSCSALALAFAAFCFARRP